MGGASRRFGKNPMNGRGQFQKIFERFSKGFSRRPPGNSFAKGFGPKEFLKRFPSKSFCKDFLPKNRAQGHECGTRNAQPEAQTAVSAEPRASLEPSELDLSNGALHRRPRLRARTPSRISANSRPERRLGRRIREENADLDSRQIPVRNLSVAGGFLGVGHSAPVSSENQ